MTSKEMEERGALSVPETARYLGLCNRTVYERIKDGTLESVRLGPKRRLILKSSIDRLLLGGRDA